MAKTSVFVSSVLDASICFIHHFTHPGKEICMKNKKKARIEKVVAQTEQNEKNIDRVETQSNRQFEMLLNRMDAVFNGLKSELKADVHHLETELKTDRRWFNGLKVTSVIGGLTILWQILKYLEVIQNSP